MELASVMLTAIALGVGIALASWCKRTLQLDNGALLAAVVFAPTFIYLGLSGRLVEFKGLGLEAKFQTVARATVVPTAQVKPSSPSASTVESQSRARAYLGMGAEVVLLRAGPEQKINVYDVAAVARKIYPGLLDGSFQALVVLDDRERVLGYFQRTYFYDLLRIEIEQALRGARLGYDEKRVNEQLEQTQLWDLVAHPGIRSEHEGLKLVLINSISNAEALQQLSAAGQDVGVVVDHAGRYSGIVTSRAISQLLLNALAGAPAK